MTQKQKIRRGMHVIANFGGGDHRKVYVKSVRKSNAVVSFHPGGSPSDVATARIKKKHLRAYA